MKRLVIGLLISLLFIACSSTKLIDFSSSKEKEEWKKRNPKAKIINECATAIEYK